MRQFSAGCQCAVLARRVALVGGVSFLITFLVVLDGTTDGSPFGYGFFPGAVALVTWTAATSVSTYRKVTAASPATASA